VFCPRCGTDNADENRFCVSCGSQLPRGADESAGPRPEGKNRLGRIVGRSRKERVITGATVLAIVVAIIAFLALKPTGDETPAGPPSVDTACVQAKQSVAAAATQARGKGQAGFQSYSASLIAALLQFRDTVSSTAPAGGNATQLESALRNAAIEAGGLARLAREGAPQAELAAQAGRLDATTRRVDDASRALGLDRCAQVRIVPATPRQG
jgi:hypothetical protein